MSKTGQQVSCGQRANCRKPLYCGKPAIAGGSWWLAGVLVAMGATCTQAQWEALAAKVPQSSNAIVLVDVDKLLASPIAKREGWAEKLERAFESGVLALPPGATRVLEAAELDFETWEPRYELALLQASHDVTLVNLARQTHGRSDVVADLPAVVLPQDAYVVALNKRQIAGLSPANRQATIRWLREVLHRDKPALSPYLASAVELASHIDIVEALDMQDAVPADVIRAKVKASAAVAGAKPAVNVEQLVNLLATLRGVTFELVFKDQVHARFLIDLGADAAPLATVGKPLLLEILRKHGAWIEDFDGWKPSVSKQQFVLTGTLTATGLRKVLSLIDAPVAALATPGEAPPAGAEASSAMAYASFAYFKSIKSILADIRTESKDSVTLGQNAAWLDRWARKIERLPILNVDPDLLDYGAFVVAKLRGSSDSLKGIGINSAYRSAGIQDTTQGWVAGGYSGYYGRYVTVGGYFEDSGDAQRRQVRTEERTKGASQALSQIRTIDQATATARRLMTERYKMEF